MRLLIWRFSGWDQLKWIKYSIRSVFSQSESQPPRLVTKSLAFDKCEIPIPDVFGVVISRVSRQTTYRHDGADRLVETAYANLAKTLRAYDAAGQLESLKHLRAGGTLHAETYVHDGNGNRTSLTVEDGSTPQVTTYGYDVADRLISEVSSTRRVLDTLDAAGNRVGRLIQDGAGVQQQRLVYTLNARDQVTGIETRNASNAVTGTEVLVYDANGNRMGRSLSGVTQTHRDDRRNRVLAHGGVRYAHDDADVRRIGTIRLTVTLRGGSGRSTGPRSRSRHRAAPRSARTRDCAAVAARRSGRVPAA